MDQSIGSASTARQPGQNVPQRGAHPTARHRRHRADSTRDRSASALRLPHPGRAMVGSLGRPRDQQVGV